MSIEKDHRLDAKINGKYDSTEPPPTNRTFKSALPQILASSAKNILLLGYGMTLGFPTIVIPTLQVPGSKLNLTTEQISWFSSISYILVPIGAVFSGLVTQPFGRRRSMQFMNIPFIASWLIFYFAESVEWLYFALALTGLAGGLMEAPVLTYVAEITEPHLRGFLSATASLSVIFGIFFQFVMGNFLTWRTISLINSSAPILAVIVLCFIPESPHWLVMKNRIPDAEKALCWLRGWTTPSEIQPELNHLIKTIRPDLIPENAELKSKETMEQQTTKENKCAAMMEPYSRRTFYLPFLLISYVFFAGHFSGMTTLMTFAVNIFATLGAPVDKYLATMVLGIGQLGGTFLCVVLVHYVGKRPLVLCSIVGSSVAFTLVGFYARNLGVENLDNGALIHEKFEMHGIRNEYSWVPLTCLVTASFLAHCGYRLIPWMLIGEVYPAEVRSFGSGLSGSVGYIIGFSSNKTFFKLIEAFTLPGVYWFYGTIGALAFVVLLFTLPETEGWALSDVQEHFAGVRNLVWEKRKLHEKTSGVDNPAMVNDEATSKL